MSNIIENESGIAIPEETQQSIVEMNTVAAGLAELESQYATMPDVNTPEGYELAKQERKEIGAVRIKVEKAHKAGKAFYLEGGRTIDGMKNDILKIVTSLEDERKRAIKEIDDEAARAAQEAAEKEQARIEGIEKRIETIKNSPFQAMSLEHCEVSIAHIDALDLEELQEFKDSATPIIETALAELVTRKNEYERQEAEAAKLEEQRLKQERIAKEQKEAQDKIDAERKALEDAKLEAERKEQQAIREKAQAEQAEKNKQAALDAAEAKRLKDIEAAKQQAIREEQERAELQKQREAEAEAERQRVAAESPDKDQLIAWLDSLPALPEMKTQAGKKRRNLIEKSISELYANIESMASSRKKAA